MNPNPYPWLPDWYWTMYASTIAEFDHAITEIQRLARERGFTIAVIGRTPPQIGSAGTVVMRIGCSVLGLDSTRQLDDRLVLSFGSDYLRLLRWWVRYESCLSIQPPSQVEGEAVRVFVWQERTGRYIDPKPLSVLVKGLRVLFHET